MKRETSGQILSAVFVDYDNVYLSLKRRSEEAAKRFAKDAGVWLAEIESGRLISPTNKLPTNVQRRIVLNRCYGNPVPRRNQNDNSTDMNSFPFVRHHFLRAGFEVIDCPPLTAQLKNSSDIRMVMDVRDYLHHETHFDEFIILSGDADFTPVLHRLRAHARRTVVFANDYTAAPYVAIADGEIREPDLINVLLNSPGTEAEAQSRTATTSDLRREIMAEVTGAVRNSDTPLPLEVLAERATRALGHDRTVGTNWAGAGSFRDLLLQSLPEGIRLSEQPPYVVYDATRTGPEEIVSSRTDRPAGLLAPRQSRPASAASAAASVLAKAIEPFGISRRSTAQQSTQTSYHPSGPSLTQSFHDAMTGSAQAGAPRSLAPPSAPPSQPPQPLSRGAEGATALQQSIARIHEASKAPPLSPPEYRALFELLAQEINTNGVQGAQTVANVASRARELGLDIRREDVRFALDVVGEPDPWFEQGASANLFAGRFRNYVVARCRSHGLNLTPDEIDLIDAWFTGGGSPSPPVRQPAQDHGQGHPRTSNVDQPAPPPAAPETREGGWWSFGERQSSSEPQAGSDHGPGASQQRAPSTALSGGDGDYLGGDEFPRIVRTRLRG